MNLLWCRKLKTCEVFSTVFYIFSCSFLSTADQKQNRARRLALGGGKWNREGGISICVEFLLNSLIRGFRKSRARSWIKLDFIPPELNFRVWIYTISDMEACLSNNCCIFFTIKAWRPFTSWLKLIRPWQKYLKIFLVLN